jgi:hypothetical protein
MMKITLYTKHTKMTFFGMEYIETLCMFVDDVLDIKIDIDYDAKIAMITLDEDTVVRYKITKIEMEMI